MRTDHYAYERAAKVAGLGLLLQLAMGLALLIFGRVASDSPVAISAIYLLPGVFVWLSLVVVYHQHKLERLEALEEDELAAAREGTSSVFDASEEIRVAARRLRLMHAWMMPIVSLLLSALLALLAYFVLRRLQGIETRDADELGLTTHVGWAAAMCLAFALASFVFSRFVAGMAKQPAWQNLRGGAAYMVGNSLVLLAVAAGLIFRFFDNDSVIKTVVYAIPIFMLVLAAEMVLNFVLNIYRPRIPGETPRPAFDSKALSLLAAPDSLVRSLNEAVNYQFGFDVTSSWGYQLLLRSFVWLILLGLVVLGLLNTMVVVEPQQQGVKLAGGRIVGDVHGSGIMWKLPWPFQSAEVYDVTRIRDLALTARVTGPTIAHLWNLELETDEEMEPFLVRSSRLDQEDLGPTLPGNEAERDEVEEVSDVFALVDAEIVIQYRIRTDGGLSDYLMFGSETLARRSRLTEREKALKAMARGVVSVHLASLSIDKVLATRRADLAGELREIMQTLFDEVRTGVEVVAVNIPMIRPHANTAEVFEELGKSHQARLEKIALAERNVATTLAFWVGDSAMIDEVLEGIDEYTRLSEERGPSAPESVDKRLEVEALIVRSGGNAAQIIATAEKDRWVSLLAKRTQVKRLEGQRLAFEAAPELFMQRELMNVLVNSIYGARTYVIAIDPARVNIDVEIQERNPLLGFTAGTTDDQGADNQ